MASLSFAQFASLPRWHTKWLFFPSTTFENVQDLKLQKRWGLMATSKKKLVESLTQEAVPEEAVVVEKKKPTTPKVASKRGRKKAVPKVPDEDFISAVSGDLSEDETIAVTPTEGNKKPRRKAGTKVTSAPSDLEEEKIVKKVTRQRRTRKKTDDMVAVGERSDTELSDTEGDTLASNSEDEAVEDLVLELGKDGEDDITSTYGWPPLVCCFGAAQHAFVPSGRRANRLVDYEMRERMKDALWNPEKFVRAPGGSASNVAIALASLGGKVAFMGKLGDDDYGQSLLYYLNVNNVQTRSVRVDTKRVTSVTHMKIGKRGGLRMTSIKPCAEDSLTKFEINIDILKEAKMFYFNSSSLLERNMRSTALQAIKISKKLGGLIFYDLNLPLPLWQSSEETKEFIHQVWNLADIIEVTKQELEFLCGIEPPNDFDTENNDRSKFVHYDSDVIAPLWHDDLKVLFVTNGTSKVHYYTKEHNGAVRGMEEAPITPFTCDMSASGDGIVAALMRKLTLQPHLLTDKGFLEHTIKYAVNCGVIEQWLQGQTRGFPPKEGMEESVVPDQDGIRSVTQREYRTLAPVS